MGQYDHYVENLRKQGYMSDDSYNYYMNSGSINSGLSSIASNIFSGYNSGFSSSSPDYSSYFDQMLELEAKNTQMMIDAERSNAYALMNFNADQSRLQRESAQASAREQMAFEERMAGIEYERNALEAQRARDYSTEMSNTAFQRATDDLKKAGLNPILAVGSQASTPASTSSSVGHSVGSKADMSFASGVKANSSKSDVSSIFGSLAQLYASMSNVASNIYNTDVMSETQKSTANKQFTSSIIGSIASLFGIRKIYN